jgi:4-amino-4-deoxy-L-arabinose transferase-like glycosyltransferase
MSAPASGFAEPARVETSYSPIPHATSAVKSLAVLACIWFTLCGIVFIPYAGIEADEALFAGPLYSRLPREFRIRPFHQDVPLMLMSYLGTLKTWVYAGIFHVWRPGIWSVRLPAVIIGAITIWVLFLLLQRASGARAALIGCALLATDATFLLTTTFDWGPVAFQHLCLTAGMTLTLAAYQDRSRWRLGCAFFLFGLGMWDKALFVWVLSAMAIASVTIFRREMWQMVTRRNVATALAAFCLGALPLIIYNVRSSLKTFRGNAAFSTHDFASKARLVRYTMNGSALFGYLVEEEWTGNPKQPRSALERASVAIRDAAGQRRSGLVFWAFVAAVALAPLLRRERRTILFLLMTMAVAWLQMALNKDTGGGVHHVALLWPLPHMLIAVVFAGIADRLRRWGTPVVIACLAVICGASVLVSNQYLSQFVRYGAAGVWTDAIFPLSDAVRTMKDDNIFVADWGILDTLLMLEQGKARLWVGSEPLMKPEPADADLAAIQRMLEVPAPVFLCHTKGREVFPDTTGRLERAALRLGYRKGSVRTISDSNGRPVFEIVRFDKDTAAAIPQESERRCISCQPAPSRAAHMWFEGPPATRASRRLRS